VTDFIDVYLPSNIRAFPWISAPRHDHIDHGRGFGARTPKQKLAEPAAQVHSIRSGAMPRNDRRPEGSLAGVFRPVPGVSDARSARLRFGAPSEIELGADIVATDQVCGIADGLARDFQLKKTYTRGGFSYVRKIRLPILDSVLVAMNALDPSTPGPALPGGPYTYSVDRLSGAITFDPVPQNGIVVTAGYYFDVPVRFETDDEFEAIVKAFQVDGFSDLTFMETRMCGQGESE
jgi:uncharacterized protein (TIGR02217 family)